MAEISVHWERHGLEKETGDPLERVVAQTGVLTDDPEVASDGYPVLVEEESNRVFRAEDLPADTVVFLHLPPGKLPKLAARAREAGFQVAHAEDSIGDADHEASSQ